MRHWKLYVPAAPGAVTLKVNVALEPGATDEARLTRFNPQAVLPAGFCDCKLYVPAAHVVVPEFLIVTLTLVVCPVFSEEGTLCETNIALLVPPPPPPPLVTLTATFVLDEPKKTPFCFIPHW